METMEKVTYTKSHLVNDCTKINIKLTKFYFSTKQLSAIPCNDIIACFSIFRLFNLSLWKEAIDFTFTLREFTLT